MEIGVEKLNLRKNIYFVKNIEIFKILYSKKKSNPKLRKQRKNMKRN